jgi:hypothetical protein
MINRYASIGNIPVVGTTNSHRQDEMLHVINIRLTERNSILTSDKSSDHMDSKNIYKFEDKEND